MDETKIYFGDALKILDDNGKIGGYIIRFGSTEHKDLDGEYFTDKTYLGARDGNGVDVMFHHGQPLPVKSTLATPKIKAALDKLRDYVLPAITTTRDELGVFGETVLDMANDYQKLLFDFVKSGVLGWSTGAVNHLVRIKSNGEILRWPIGEVSLTPQPAEPQNHVVTLKSLSNGGPEVKGMLADEMAQMEPSYWELHMKFCEMVCNIARLAKASEETGEPYDAPAKLTELVIEMSDMSKPVLIQQVQDFIDGNNEYDFYLKALEANAPFDLAVSAARKLVKAMERNHSNRTKENRMLSTANRKKLQAYMDSLSELVTEMQGLMDASEPKPKMADPGKLRSLRLTLLRGAA